MTKRIAIFCVADSLASSVGSAADAFHFANGYVQRRSLVREAVPAPAHVQFVSEKGGILTLSGSKMSVQTAPIRDVTHLDAVVLPASDAEASHNLDDIVGQSGELAGWLRDQYHQGACLAATGPSVALVAEAGLAADRIVAAPWWLQASMQQRYGNIRFAVDEQVIQSDRIITATSVAADFDLARRLVSEMLSPFVSRWLARAVGQLGAGLLDTRDVIEQLEIADPLIGRVKLWLDENFTRPVKMRDLVERAGVCERTLVRRFERAVGSSPHAYLQTLRVEISKQMLIRTNRSVERIANLVGYSDTRFFRMLFRQKTGQTPSEFRRSAKQHAFFGSASEGPSSPSSFMANE